MWVSRLYLLWDCALLCTSTVKTRKTFACLQRPLVKRSSKPRSKLDFVEIFGPIKRNQPIHSLLDGMMEILSFESVELWYPMVWQFKSNLFGMQFFHLVYLLFSNLQNKIWKFWWILTLVTFRRKKVEFNWKSTYLILTVSSGAAMTSSDKVAGTAWVAHVFLSLALRICFEKEHFHYTMHQLYLS